MCYTRRQEREIAFYEEYAIRNNSSMDTSFDPVLGKEERPWNPYWFVYGLAKDFRHCEGLRLLDFGCGAGDASVRFARMGYQVWGFDICPANINIAKRRGEKYNLLDKLTFSIQTAERLDYQDDFFDVVIGIDILHHIDIEAAIAECHRVLKKGGKAVFKEHVMVPFLDQIRNYRLVTKLVPNDVSMSNHITHDERKLEADDLELIKSVFPNCRCYRFELLGKLKKLVRRPENPKPSILEKIDHRLFQSFPMLSKLGGTIALELTK